MYKKEKIEKEVLDAANDYAKAYVALIKAQKALELAEKKFKLEKDRLEGNSKALAEAE